MEAEGLSKAAILSFKSCYIQLVRTHARHRLFSGAHETFCAHTQVNGETGMIPEDTIAPATDVPPLETLSDEVDTSLLSETVVLKLNGGLGTGMGLDFAKSLLVVKGEDTFLDLTAKQIMSMRKKLGVNVKFMLMNSFSTSADTMEFLKKCVERVQIPPARGQPARVLRKVSGACRGSESRVCAEQGEDPRRRLSPFERVCG